MAPAMNDLLIWLGLAFLAGAFVGALITTLIGVWLVDREIRR